VYVAVDARWRSTILVTALDGLPSWYTVFDD
jgi:hypothetical protein